MIPLVIEPRSHRSLAHLGRKSFVVLLIQAPASDKSRATQILTTDTYTEEH